MKSERRRAGVDRTGKRRMARYRTGGRARERRKKEAREKKRKMGGTEPSDPDWSDSWRDREGARRVTPESQNRRKEGKRRKPGR